MLSTDNWALNIDRGNVNAVEFFHLTKAFDTVDYNMLLSKLRAYGFRETLTVGLSHIFIIEPKNALLIAVFLNFVSFNWVLPRELY